MPIVNSVSQKKGKNKIAPEFMATVGEKSDPRKKSRRLKGGARSVGWLVFAGFGFLWFVGWLLVAGRKHENGQDLLVQMRFFQFQVTS